MIAATVDTENRVILNVGGIRHETYKVWQTLRHTIYVTHKTYYISIVRDVRIGITFLSLHSM